MADKGFFAVGASEIMLEAECPCCWKREVDALRLLAVHQTQTLQTLSGASPGTPEHAEAKRLYEAQQEMAQGHSIRALYYVPSRGRA